MEIKSYLKRALVSPRLDEQLDTIPKKIGTYGYDPWGFNRETFKIGVALFKFLYDHYFRVEVRGLKNIPEKGRVLIVPNHSGQLPFDGILIGVAMATNPHGPRAPRAMVDRFVPTVPFVGNLLSQVGAVIGDPVNCVQMLDDEEAVIVFPEGVRGSGKMYQDRYQLQRFGTGFMHLALRDRTPIVPVGVVGCEETMPSIGNIKPLAKLLHVPYAPVALPFPLPARVFIHFGEPMLFESQVINEDLVSEKVEEVKDQIRILINRGLSERKRVFL